MSLPAAQRSRIAAAPGQAQWLTPLRDWTRALLAALEREPVIVRIVVAEVLGSAPREAGVCMLVGDGHIEGSIGGGQLEWQALNGARALLQGAAAPVRLQRVVLGAELAQCCGGVVQLWMERYTRADRALLRAASDAARAGAAVLISTVTPLAVEHRIVSSCSPEREVEQLLRAPRPLAKPLLTRGPLGAVTLLERVDEGLPALWLYGAGHVGQALARIMAELPLQLTWIDSRAGQFPGQVGDSVRLVVSADPVKTVADAPAGSRFLVLTHSHPLDYALCRAILERGEFAWLGLIGSKSKAARFRSRLARDGLSAAAIARLVCPIGEDGVASKWPAAIAVAVAFQILRHISAGSADSRPAAAPPVADEPCSGGNCSTCRAP